MMRVSSLLITGFALCIVGSGCHSNDVSISSISGKITVDGSVLSDCMIVFENRENHVVVTAYPDQNGVYSSAKVVPGTCRVCIKPKPRYDVPAPGEEAIELPAKYQSFETSGLETVIEAGENVFDIGL